MYGQKKTNEIQQQNKRPTDVNNKRKQFQKKKNIFRIKNVESYSTQPPSTTTTSMGLINVSD